MPFSELVSLTEESIPKVPGLEAEPELDERDWTGRAADLGLATIGTVLTPLDYILGAPGRLTRTLAYGGSAGQDFSGSGPGFDIADLWDVPIQGLRNVFLTPSLAPTGQDIRRYYAPSTRAYERNLADMPSGRTFMEKLYNLGESIDPTDFADIGIELVLDPLSFVTGPAALTARGRLARNLATTVSDPMATEGARNAARARLAALSVDTSSIGPKFTGLQPTLAGRMRAGEAGIGPNRIARWLGAKDRSLATRQATAAEAAAGVTGAVAIPGAGAGPINSLMSYPVELAGWPVRTIAATRPGKALSEWFTERGHAAEDVVKARSEQMGRNIVHRQMEAMDELRPAFALMGDHVFPEVEVTRAATKVDDVASETVKIPMKAEEVIQLAMEMTQRQDPASLAYVGPRLDEKLPSPSQFGIHAKDAERLWAMIRKAPPNVQKGMAMYAEIMGRVQGDVYQAMKASGMPFGELSAGLRAELKAAEKALADAEAAHAEAADIARAERALELAEFRLKSTVGYTPRRIAKEVEVPSNVMGAAKPAGIPSKRDLGLFDEGDWARVDPVTGETEYLMLPPGSNPPGPDWKPLDGVPMTAVQANMKALRVGVNVTAGQTPKVRPGLMSAPLSWVKGLWRHDAVKAAEDEAKLFESSPARALVDYAVRTETRALTRAGQERAVFQAANALRGRDWDLVRDAVNGVAVEEEALNKATAAVTEWAERAGYTDDQLRAWFQEKARMPKDTAQGWQRRAMFGTGEVGQHDAILPVEWDQALAKMEVGTKPEQIVRALMPTIQALGTSGFLRAWKTAQTAIWPSYHLRNLLSDSIRLVQEGVIENPDDAFKFAGYMKEILDVHWDSLPGFSDNRRQLLSAIPDLDKVRGVVTVGGKKMPMREVIEMGIRNGWLDNGFNAAVIGEALREGDELVKKGVRDVVRSTIFEGGMSRKASDLVRWFSLRENATRLAAGLLALEKNGGNELAATFDMERALFNYRSVSPAAEFLRRTGLAPFLSWSVKNIPRQVALMAEHPTQFVLYLKALDLYGQAAGPPPPDHLLPRWLQGRLTVTYSKSQDAHDRPLWWYGTVSGWMPLQDPLDISTWKGAKATALQQIGPGWRAAGEALFEQAGEERTDWLEVLRQFGGRPVDVIRKAVFEEPDLTLPPGTTWGEIARTATWPMPAKMLRTDDALRRAESRRKMLWRDAVGKFKRLRQNAAEQIAAGEELARAGTMSADAVQEVRQRFDVLLAEARGDVEEARKTIEAERRTDEMVRRMELAP